MEIILQQNIFFTYFFICRHGKPYIYDVLNWEYPKRTALVIIAIEMLGIIIHFLLFWSYLLRVIIQEQLFEMGIQD